MLSLVVKEKYVLDNGLIECSYLGNKYML